MAETTELKAGVKSIDITPPIGGELSGYGLYLDRKSQHIRRPLYAKALVLQQAETRVAIITADLLAVSTEITAQTRAAVAAATGIPADNVLIACSHTHSGPATIYLHGCGAEDNDYVALLPRYFTTAVIEAVGALEERSVYASQTTLTGLAKNRVDPAGAVDTTVQALEFVRLGARQDYVLFSFSCHPVSSHSTDTGIDSDLTGVAQALIQRADYDEVLFLQGSCGDINPVLAHEEEEARCGQMLAGAALVAMAQSREVENLTPLRCLRRTIELPLHILAREELEQRRDTNRALLAEHPADSREGRTPRFWVETTENLLEQLSGGDVPKTLPCELQAVRIGDIAFIAHPTELFAEFGLEIKARSPFPHTFVVGYANNFLGYIPNEADYARRGYAADMVPFLLDLFPYTSNIGRVFVEECVRLLNDLRAA